MIKLILNNSFLNGINSHILNSKSGIQKPVFILFIISLSLIFLALESLLSRLNPQKLYLKKQNPLGQVKTAH
jgi:hypothetical protein